MYRFAKPKSPERTSAGSTRRFRLWLCRITVSPPAFQAENQGSIPCEVTLIRPFLSEFVPVGNWTKTLQFRYDKCHTKKVTNVILTFFYILVYYTSNVSLSKKQRATGETIKSTAECQCQLTKLYLDN